MPIQALLQIHHPMAQREIPVTPLFLFSAFCSFFFRLRVDCLRGNSDILAYDLPDLLFLITIIEG